MVRIGLDRRLIIPFGCEKREIASIRVAGVSSQGTFLEVAAPCAYIDLATDTPLWLRDIDFLFPERIHYASVDAESVLEGLCNHLKKYCDERASDERLFLDTYFSYCRSLLPSLITKGWPNSRHGQEWLKWLSEKGLHPNWIFYALIPLPQAHLYLLNPLTHDELDFDVKPPPRMVKIDFLFWTGREMVAVEIDGQKESDFLISRDRQLQNAGIKVVHILNKELREFGTDALIRLLPESITFFWRNRVWDAHTPAENRDRYPERF